EVTQTRGALAGAIAWRANDNLTVKFDTLWSQYRIKENQFQAWYGNNILGNWADGNGSIYNAPGNSYTISNGTVVAATLNASPGNNWPNYESEIARYDEQHTLLVTGLNGAWTAGAWDGQVDLSFSNAERRNRWEAIYLADQYVPNLVYNLADGQVPYAATPGANPADPTMQSVSPARQGQSD